MHSPCNRCLVAFSFTANRRRRGKASCANSCHRGNQRGMLIGGAQGARWIRADAFAKRLKGAQRFNLYGLEGPAGEITISKVEPNGDWDGEWFAQTLSKTKAGNA